jgi:hypothetical protein
MHFQLILLTLATVGLAIVSAGASCNGMDTAACSEPASDDSIPSIDAESNEETVTARPAYENRIEAMEAKFSIENCGLQSVSVVLAFEVNKANFHAVKGKIDSEEAMSVWEVADLCNGKYVYFPGSK